MVLVSGPYGTEKLELLHELGQTTGAIFHELRTREVPGRVLQRRLEVFHEFGPSSPHDAARLFHQRSPAGLPGEGHFLVQDVDLLDDESLKTLELVMRRQQVGVLMTASAPGHLRHRYSRVLESPRGMSLTLTRLVDDESMSLLSHVLESPPTRLLVDYLRRSSGDTPHSLLAAVQEGVEEGWIESLGSRSVVMRPPLWLGSRATRTFRRDVHQRLGDAALELLEDIAASGSRKLSVLLETLDPPDAVFWFEEAGLLRSDRWLVRIASPMHQHSLLFGNRSAARNPPETAEGVLAAKSAGLPISRPCAVFASGVFLERGLLGQARFVAAALARDDPFARVVEACACVLEGAPRRALQALPTTREPNPESAEGMVAVLAAFIKGVLLQIPLPEDCSLGPFESLMHRLQIFEDSSPGTYLDAVPPQQLGHSPAGTGQAGPPEGIDLKLLADAAEMALDSYAAAIAGHQGRALDALQQFAQLPAWRIPVVGMTWVLENVGLSRILTSPAEAPLPASWFAQESEDRGLLRTVTAEALILLQALVCGQRVDTLRCRLEDLWAQFEGGLGHGRTTREVLEAFDFAVEGERSKELIGPAGLVSPMTCRALEHPWVDVVIVIGKLLHCPIDAVETLVEETLADSLETSGAHRMVTRCVILRRGMQLPPRALERLVDLGREFQVEPAVIDVAAARSTGSAEQIALTLGRLALKHPEFTVTQTPDSTSGRPAHLRLRSDRMHLLSDREGEVSELLISGVSVPHVSERLGISVRTVQTHVRNVYKKLKVSSRTELRAELLPSGEVRP